MTLNKVLSEEVKVAKTENKKNNRKGYPIFKILIKIASIEPLNHALGQCVEQNITYLLQLLLSVDGSINE